MQAAPVLKVHNVNLDSERAVLGTLLMTTAKIDQVRALVSTADFYDPRHAVIFTAIINLHDLEQPIDPMVLISDLGGRGSLEDAGGVAYISALEENVISPNNVTYHAGVVKANAIRRDLSDRLGTITDNIQDSTVETKALARSLADALDGLSKRMASHHIATSEELAQRLWDSLLDGMETKGRGLLSGIPKIDHLLNGFQPGDLIILAARPSVGKTSMALQFALHALKSDAGVIIFSLEMAEIQLMERLTSQETSIPLAKIKRKGITEGDLEGVEAFLNRLKGWKVFIEDGAAIDSSSIFSQSTLIKTQHPEVGLIVVDYLQLMDYGTGGAKEENRNLELGRISRGLKQLARTLNVPVLALSQLSRGMDKTGRRPVLSDLRDSGAFEQDADIVAFLHRKENKNNEDLAFDDVDFIVAKHRNGALGTVPLAFLQERTFFVEAVPTFQNKAPVVKPWSEK